MENNQSSQIVSNNEVENEIPQNTTQSGEIQNRDEPIIETQPISEINRENNNSFELKKWLIVGSFVVLALIAFLVFAKGTDVCFAITCNDYGDSAATGSTSIGNDFLAYAGGAATLLVLTAVVGVPLLPAVAISTGVWFFMQIIH